MRNVAYTDEDLTPFVKKVLKESEEFEEAESESGSTEITDIADKMNMDDVPEGEPEDMNVTIELDALVDLVGDERAQKLYNICCERGPNIPLTVDDIESCCPGAEEVVPEEGDLEGYEEGAAVGEEEMSEGPEEVEDFGEGFESATEGEEESEGEGEGEEESEDIEAIGGEEEAELEAGCDSSGAVSTGAVAAGGEDDTEAGGDDVEGGILDIAIGNEGETQAGEDAEGGADATGANIASGSI